MPMTDTRKPLVIVGSVVGALIVLTLLVSALRPITTLDPKTPDGVVQAYIQALLDDDEALAEEYVTNDFLDDCDPYRRSSNTNRYSITESGDYRDGYLVSVQESSSDAFGGYSQEIDFFLLDQDGDWLIDSADWPFGCGAR